MSQTYSKNYNRQQTINSYNKLSRWYDLMAGDFERKPRNSAIQQLTPSTGENILEIGCGTGQAIVKMTELVGQSGKVFGIDISNGMLSIAQARTNKLGLGDQVTLLCGDGMQLPFEAGCFDGILISFILELFNTPEIPLVLSECLRCLRSNGRISVVGLSKKNPNLMTEIYEWFHEKLPAYVDCRPIFVQKELEKAGFQILQTSVISMMGLKSELVLAQSPI